MNTYKKKLIGTSLFLFMLSSMVLGGFSFANAQFIENFKTIVFDGYVDEFNSNSITLIKPDTYDFVTVLINEDTVYAGQLKFSSIAKGDWLRIVGKTNGNGAVAKVIRRDNNSGYGNSGKVVNIKEAKLTYKDPTGTYFRVSTEAADNIVFRINPSTKFIFSEFDDLEVDKDILHIIGSDSGNEFLARVVILVKNQRGNQK